MLRGRKVAKVGDIVIAPNMPKDVCDKLHGTYTEFDINGKRVQICAFKVKEDGDGVRYEPLDFKLDDTFLRSKIIEALNSNESE
ncbi:MAG: hypothetical protein L3J47_11555 [Sulfurovum sp.]|nr:hypothetical protein [Sulfurovum sp.]